MKRTQISLTEEQAAELRRLSAARHRSQAALLRDAVALLIGSEESKARLERARRPVGAYRSGSRQTSARHDEVLAESFVD